jgi:uncharacterized protein (DUF697 family)
MASAGKYDNDEQYDDILTVAILAAAASGPSIIIPGADVGAVAGIWTTMVMSIAEKNGVTLEKKATGKIMLTILTGLGAYVGSVKVFLAIVSKIPGIGMLGASAANSIANIVLTIWLAFTMIDLFDRERGVKNLEGYTEFILGALRPKSAMTKMGGRTAALLRRQGAAIRARLA